MSSCTLKPSFKIANEQLASIREFLFTEAEENPIPDTSHPDEEDELLDENDSNNSQGTEAPAFVHNWLDPEIESSEKSEFEGEPSEDAKWFRNCLISIAPTLDFLVLAAVQRFVALGKSTKASHSLAVDCRIRVVDKNVYITSIFVLPIASTRKAEASLVDWHCVVVGLSSGHLNFYTERGVLIFVEHVSNHPIKSIRFASSICADNQELAVLSQSKVIVIEGLSLFTTLKTARSSIARGDRTVEELSATLELNFNVFQMDSLRGLYDFHIVGAVKPSYPETYATASRSETGANTKVSLSAPPIYSSYFAMNKNHFGVFSWYDRNQTSNPLTEAVQKITNQISNAVPLPSFGFRSWLGIGVSRRDLPKKRSAFDATVTRLPIRTALSDDSRIADRVYLAPEPWNLIAVTDENARVMLINSETRRVIRIWKGYRNARCAWIESHGKTSNKTNQNARTLFLAIFAPRRGLLEIWLMTNGPRIGQFNVDRHGRLLPISPFKDSVLGCHSESFLNALSAVFVSVTGSTYVIQVPFHLAATDASTTLLHDENLLKEFQLNSLIKKQTLDQQRWLDFVGSLKSIAAKKRCVTELCKVDKLEAGDILDVFNQVSAELSSNHSKNPETTSFQHYLTSLKSLIRAYVMIKETGKSPVAETKELLDEQLRSNLCLDEEEYDSLCIRLIRPSINPKSETPNMSLVKFLDQFAISPDLPYKETHEESCHKLQSLSGVDEIALSSLLFSPFFQRKAELDELFGEILYLLKITEKDALDLFLRFWLEPWNKDPFAYTDKCLDVLKRFYTTIMKNLKDFDHRLKSSDNVQTALVCYLCLRAIKRKQSIEKGLPVDVDEGTECKEEEDEEEATILNDDYFEWIDLLISHFDCLSLLISLPGCPPQSLDKLISQGYGYYRAQAGLWSANGMLTAGEILAIVSHKAEEEKSTDSGSKDSAKKILKELVKKFPLSFQSDLVLADCTWEAASAWYKDESRKTAKLKLCMDFLEANSSNRLQHGLALMLWDTFIMSPFKNLVTCLNRRGGVCPPDRIARREVLTTENELLDFVLCVKRLLQVLCAAVVDLEFQPKPIEEFEDFIENFFDHLNENSVSKRKLLSEAAANQKTVNYHLCLHHLHLATVLELQLTLGIKNKPEILFDQVGLRAFFDPFHSHPLIPLGNKDVSELLRHRRQRFIEQCIQSVGVASDSQYFDRWETALFLASEWQLNVDSCRTKEILMLYENGFDDEAASIIPLIHDRKILAQELISVIAVRLHQFFNQNSTIYDRIVQNSVSTPETLEYVTSFVETITPATYEQIQAVIRHVKTLLMTSNQNEFVAHKLKLLKELEQINTFIANTR